MFGVRALTAKQHCPFTGIYIYSFPFYGGGGGVGSGDARFILLKTIFIIVEFVVY